jgi:general secretion pathway protein D
MKGVLGMLLKLRKPGLLLLLLCLLAGCAARQAFDEGSRLYDSGHQEAGLSKLGEAVRLDPDAVEYRLALLTRRTSYVNTRLASAEQARQQGLLEQAEQGYRDVQHLEPDNVMARQGLDMVSSDRQHLAQLDQADSLLDKHEEREHAQQLVHDVLAADPANARARQLLAHMQSLRPPATASEVKLAAAFRKPVTLDFHDAPLSAVFDMIGKSSGLNFFFDRDVKSDLKTTITARNIPIENAIRVITTTNQLAVRPLDDSSLLIYPDTAQKQDDYQPVMVRTFHLANADVKTVAATLKTALNIKNVVQDERLGLIIVRDTPTAIRAVERLVALEDQPDAEVLLEVEVLEVQRDRMTQAGITWPDTLTLSPLSSSSTGSAGTGSGAITLNQLRQLNSNTIQAQVNNATVKLHDENQDSNILANPRIRVKNKEKAKILIGDKLPVFTTTSTSTGFISDSVNYLDVGLKLEVQPDVSVDQDVSININLEVSTVVSQITSASGTQAYEIGTRNASTVLRLRDGETQLLAGLINDQESSSAVGIPLLHKLPLIGRLFGTPTDSKKRSEIVLSITPHILRSLKRQDLFEAEFASGTGAGISHDPLHFDFLPDTSGKPVTTPALPPAAVTVSPVPAAAAATPTAAPRFHWAGPASVKPGELLTLELQVDAPQGLNSLPLTMGYDPAVLQAVSVQEGDVLHKAGIPSLFGSRIDPQQGHIQATLARQQAAAGPPASALAGSVLQVRFKAVKALSSTEVSLLGANMGGADPVPALPVNTRITVEQ